MSRHKAECAHLHDPLYADIAVASLDVACTAVRGNVPCTSVYASAGPAWECASVDTIGCWYEASNIGEQRGSNCVAGLGGLGGLGRLGLLGVELPHRHRHWPVSVLRTRSTPLMTTLRISSRRPLAPPPREHAVCSLQLFDVSAHFFRPLSCVGLCPHCLAPQLERRDRLCGPGVWTRRAGSHHQWCKRQSKQLQSIRGLMQRSQVALVVPIPYLLGSRAVLLTVVVVVVVVVWLPLSCRLCRCCSSFSFNSVFSGATFVCGKCIS